MYYYFALTQVVVYLLAIPLLDILLNVDSPHDLASLSVAGLFVASVVFGHFLSSPQKKRTEHYRAMHQFTAVGQLIIVLWCTIHITLCIQYGLYDRRIGTETIALLFSGLSVYELIAIRALEIFLPYLLTIALFNARDGTGVLRYIVPVALISAFIASGAVNSRSQTLVLGLAVLILVQNVLPRRRLSRLLLIFTALGIATATLVTVNRVTQAYDVDATSYTQHEFVKRLDGLEIVSTLIKQGGVSLFGQSPETLLLPLIAAMPVSQRATELKALALTTVKANILENELSSNERDVNSFVITDAYYLGGLLGTCLIGLLVGFVAKYIDRRVGLTKSPYIHLLLVACICDGLVLERESIGIIASVLRDWVLLIILMRVICIWKITSPTMSRFLLDCSRTPAA